MFRLQKIQYNSKYVIENVPKTPVTSVHRLGDRFSLNSEVLRVKFGKEYFAVKIVPIADWEYKGEEKNLSDAWTEYSILNKCTKSVLNGHNYFMPVLYAIGLYDKVPLTYYGNPNVIFKIKKSRGQHGYGTYQMCYFNELAETDLMALLQNKRFNWGKEESIKGAAADANFTSKLNDIYNEILMGLYTLHQKFNMIHMDLHPGNVLIHTVEKEETFNIEINISGAKRYMHIEGIYAVIWDFGESLSPKYNSLEVDFSYYYKTFFPKFFGKYHKDLMPKFTDKAYFKYLYSLDIWRISVQILQLAKAAGLLVSMKNTLARIEAIALRALEDLFEGMLEGPKVREPMCILDYLNSNMSTKVPKKIDFSMDLTAASI